MCRNFSLRISRPPSGGLPASPKCCMGSQKPPLNSNRKPLRTGQIVNPGQRVEHAGIDEQNIQLPKIFVKIRKLRFTGHIGGQSPWQCGGQYRQSLLPPRQRRCWAPVVGSVFKRRPMFPFPRSAPPGPPPNPQLSAHAKASPNDCAPPIATAFARG